MKKRTVWAVLCTLLAGLLCTACAQPEEPPQPIQRPCDVINNTDSFTLELEQIGVVEPIGECVTMQGGCATEDYLWAALIKWDKDYSKSVGCVVKYDLKTMKEVCRSEVLKLDHANDLTYREDSNEIYVNHNYYGKFTVLDADTLAKKQELTDLTACHGIAYEPVTKRFAFVFESGSQKTSMIVTDESFQQLYRKAGINTTLITQGVFADEKYIYHVFYSAGRDEAEMQNMIFVTDWDGKLVTKIPLDMGELEPENISIVGDTFYICTYGGKEVGNPVLKGKLVKISTEE